jgi:hypothetical protein
MHEWARGGWTVWAVRERGARHAGDERGAGSGPAEGGRISFFCFYFYFYFFNLLFLLNKYLAIFSWVSKIFYVRCY